MIAGAIAAAVVVACGSSSSKKVDAGLDACRCDAPIDAPGSNIGSGSSALGQTCTQGSNGPQGSCPAGFDCLSLTGGTNPWCSKRCTTGSADTCNLDYPGPGYGYCDLSVTIGSGSGSAVQYCSVTCSATGSAASTLCPSPATCNGTCPGTLACSGTISSSGGTVGMFCQ